MEIESLSSHGFPTPESEDAGRPERTTVVIPEPAVVG